MEKETLMPSEGQFYLRQNNKKFNFIPLLILVGLIVIEVIVQIFLTFIIKESVVLKNSIIWFFSKFVTLIVAVFIMRTKLKNDLFIFKDFKKMIVFFIVGFGIFYLFEISSSSYHDFMDKLFKIGQASNQEGIYSYFKASSNVLNYILLLSTIVIVAPILEELEFRELVMDTFLGLPWFVGAIISGALFGLIHLNFANPNLLKELAYFPIYALPGFALGMIYHYSKDNIYITILCHMTVNLLSSIQILFMITGGGTT